MPCEHLKDTPVPEGRTEGCEECLEAGGSWVHLRVCRTCGHVGCCDNSAGQHATKHYRLTAHPVIQSWEPGETWGWCYVDEEMLGPFPPAR